MNDDSRKCEAPDCDNEAAYSGLHDEWGSPYLYLVCRQHKSFVKRPQLLYEQPKLPYEQKKTETILFDLTKVPQWLVYAMGFMIVGIIMSVILIPAIGAAVFLAALVGFILYHKTQEK